MGTCLYKLLKDIMKLASFHDLEGRQLLSILRNRLSSAPTAANNPKQQQQQNGADNKQQAASVKQQQQVPRRRRVELNPAKGGGVVLIYQVIALRSWAPTLLAKARQTPASYS